MYAFRVFVPILVILLLPVSSIGEEKKNKENRRPQALIIGDSIYNTPTSSARALMKDRVDLVYGKFASYDTATALENFGKLLDEKKWDLIHFNFGINDLMYKDPSTKAIRAMSKEVGGVRVTSPELYEKNLRKLVKRFEATGAELIWASTTPIQSSKYDDVLDPGSEIEYNKIAAKVMAERKVSINDMHAYVLANVKDKKDPSPFWFNRVPLHPPIVDSILNTLKLSEQPK